MILVLMDTGTGVIVIPVFMGTGTGRATGTPGYEARIKQQAALGQDEVQAHIYRPHRRAKNISYDTYGAGMGCVQV